MSGDANAAAILATLFKRGREIQDAERCENSFYEFCKGAWSQVDTAEFSDNWHLEDICNHMEAVARGYMLRLLLNEPPRTGKTFIVSICFAAWVWAQRNRAPLMGPQVSFFYASYAEQLSNEHSIKCAQLIHSKWYQARWGHRFTLTRENKGYLGNDKGGYRMCSSVDAKATGWGADVIVADDPHLVKEAESDDVRESTVKWWSESMPSRLNNRKVGAMIVVMQRVHEGDLSGYILDPKNGLNYVHFCVPMSYVPCFHVNAWVDRQGEPVPAEQGVRIKTFIGERDVSQIPDESIFWMDHRTEENELLWEDRFPVEEVYKLEKELGPYAFAGQYQQEPAPRGGGIIRYEWWQPFDGEKAKELGVPVKEDGVPKEFPPVEFCIAALDTAYTEKEENDPSALSIWGIFRDKAGNPKIMLMFCWAERHVFHDLVSRVAADCKKFKVDRLLIEDKAVGHSVSQELSRLFSGYNYGIELVNPRTGFIKSADKVARLQSVVHLFAEGMIYSPDVEWADDMKRECALVPRAIHDDRADTASMALLWLRRAGLALRRDEHAAIMQEETRYRRRTAALYPV